MCGHTGECSTNFWCGVGREIPEDESTWSVGQMALTVVWGTGLALPHPQEAGAPVPSPPPPALYGCCLGTSLGYRDAWESTAPL